MKKIIAIVIFCIVPILTVGCSTPTQDVQSQTTKTDNIELPTSTPSVSPDETPIQKQKNDEVYVKIDKALSNFENAKTIEYTRKMSNGEESSDETHKIDFEKQAVNIEVHSRKGLSVEPKYIDVQTEVYLPNQRYVRYNDNTTELFEYQNNKAEELKPKMRKYIQKYITQNSAEGGYADEIQNIAEENISWKESKATKYIFEIDSNIAKTSKNKLIEMVSADCGHTINPYKVTIIIDDQDNLRYVQLPSCYANYNEWTFVAYNQGIEILPLF